MNRYDNVNFPIAYLSEEMTFVECTNKDALRQSRGILFYTDTRASAYFFLVLTTSAGVRNKHYS